MREIAFYNKNIKKWQEFESILSQNKKTDPDHLSDLYIQLTDDLAYAQSNYPGSKTNQYLNTLAGRTHHKIYSNKKERVGRIKIFWTVEFPLIVYRQRKNMLISLLVFLLSCIIGAYSTSEDIDFVRLILGDEYVNTTIENIDEGNPLGIYSSMPPLQMFLFITFNNIKVSFMVFAAGIFLSLATGLMLFYNGIMLGCFQYFFYAKNLLLISLLTIWVHGTLEITSIVIAGGAGITMGNSIAFPGTYTRKLSFQRAAKESVKVIVGLIPFFIVAGFLEGFVTRYSHISTIPAAFIISLSVLFILYYFIYHPYKLTNTQQNNGKS